MVIFHCSVHLREGRIFAIFDPFFGTSVGSPFHRGTRKHPQPGENLKQLRTVQKVGEHATWAGWWHWTWLDQNLLRCDLPIQTSTKEWWLAADHQLLNHPNLEHRGTFWRWSWSGLGPGRNSEPFSVWASVGGPRIEVTLSFREKKMLTFGWFWYHLDLASLTHGIPGRLQNARHLNVQPNKKHPFKELTPLQFNFGSRPSWWLKWTSDRRQNNETEENLQTWWKKSYTPIGEPI